MRPPGAEGRRSNVCTCAQRDAMEEGGPRGGSRLISSMLASVLSQGKRIKFFDDSFSALP